MPRRHFRGLQVLRKLSFALSALLLSASVLPAASFVNGQAARAVIGQNNFTDATYGADQNILGGVSGIAYSGGKLFAADSNRLSAIPQNNRVLIFDTTQIPGPGADLVMAPHPSSTCWLCGFYASTVIGQQDFTSNTPGRNAVPTNTGAENYAGTFNIPTAVASNGTILAVADTDNNRVLIWSSIPTSNTVPPNIVLGQADFTSFQSPQPVNANSLRGPEGVWIQGTKVFVADTLNHRVLIWNSIPTQNNQPADIVLGQENFSAAFAPLTGSMSPPTAATHLYSPTSVTSDGTRLFVADLGSNRVLIWNSIPTASTQPADVVLGQPDMTTGVPNWVDALCADKTARRCESTLNFPRFALSDGTRLFIADGGNDRVLIYNSIPTVNGAPADAVLGQPDFAQDIVSTATQSIASTVIDNTAAVDTTPSPTSLAWDGTNLYVSDPFNRRVLLFTPGDVPIPTNSVVNWASEIIRQEGVVVIGPASSTSAITANDTVTITIAGTGYTYTVKTNDTYAAIAQGLVDAINANGGDPNVTALLRPGSSTVYLSSKQANLGFDAISLAASASNTANLALQTSGSYLSAGTAATASPGMLVEINAPSGVTLADQNASIPEQPTSDLQVTLGGVQVYMDGIPQPLVKVSPSQIVTLVPWSFADRNSTSTYIKTQRGDGSTTLTNATSAYIAPANPGLFGDKSGGGIPPFPAANARHQPGNPEAVISIDGTAKAGDTATITVFGDRAYSYTVIAGEETLGFVVLRLAEKINAANDPDVTASIGAAFNRIILTARRPGIAGNGIAVAGSTSANAQLTVTPYTPATCCDVQANTPITVNNPAQAGEVITLSAAGLGLIGQENQPVAGQLYNGPVPNTALNFVSATMGGSTGQIVSAGIPTGSYGKYDVQMIVPSNLSANSATQVYIAQNAFVSNIVTLPVGTPTGIPDTPATQPVVTPPIVSAPAPPPAPVCTYSLSSSSKSYLANANDGAIGVTTQGGCPWTASVDQSWISISNSATNTGIGFVTFHLSDNGTGASRSAVLTVAGQPVTITQSASASPNSTALRFLPLATPCRVADTRGAQGPLVTGGSTRDFQVVSSACGIPATARAYAMNVTVVPPGPLTYLTVFPAGVTRPLASTLNSLDGRIKANAAIVPAGANGAVSVFATNDTHVVLDVTGYFVPATTPGALAFYPFTSCRLLDTRLSTGIMASRPLTAGQARTIPVLSSACNVPATAEAYSLNVTAIPKTPLTYLTVWPGGQAQPATSTLNAPTGTTVANAAIVPAGTGGSLSVFSTADADLVLDINGYFAPAGDPGALNLYTATPCRALDTRIEALFAPVNGAFSPIIIGTSGCNVPASAQFYIFNATAVPQNQLSYLTLWSYGAPQTTVSTLNAYDGAVTSNLAIVPAGSAAISAFTSDPSHLILDLLGYFAP